MKKVRNLKVVFVFIMVCVLARGDVLSSPSKKDNKIKFKPNLLIKDHCPNMDCGFLLEEGIKYEIKTKTDIYSEKSKSSQIKASIQPGEKVKVLMSQVDYLPGKAEVTSKPHYSLDNVPLKKGDLVYIFPQRSEGYSSVQIKGETHSTKISRSKDYCGRENDELRCWVKVIDEPEYIEWLKIKWPKKQITGWIQVGMYSESQWDGKIHTPVVARGPQTVHKVKLGQVINKPGKYGFPGSKCNLEIEKFNISEWGDEHVLLDMNKRYNKEIGYITGMAWYTKDEIVFSASSFGNEPGIYLFDCSSKDPKRRIYPENVPKRDMFMAADQMEYFVLDQLKPKDKKVIFYTYPNKYDVGSSGSEPKEVAIK